MDGTPKLQRKVSLSLGNKLQRKRHSASPQNRLRARSTVERDSNCSHAAAALDEADPEPPPRSPSVISLSSDCSTPPHRKSVSLDDSIDFSPKLMDTSLSPSILFSQTLVADSPEVDWRWNRRCGHDSNATTLKAAEEATSSLAQNRERRKLPHLSCNDNRRKQEQEMRRAQQTRAHELLKQRCEKFHKQLEELKDNKPAAKANSELSLSKAPKLDKGLVTKSKSDSQSLRPSTIKKFNTSADVLQVKPSPKEVEPETRKPPEAKQKTNVKEAMNNDAVDDFFNDSDMDCFLLEATQKLESEIVTLTQQPNTMKAPEAEVTFPVTNKPNKKSALPSTITTPTSHKEKRSSFYMQFLEDETPDEWFTALDEAVREATQPKKPRTSLQRYKSMPVTTTASSDTAASSAKTTSTVVFSGGDNSTTPTSSSASRFKRHASTHALSPLARCKLFGSRK